MSRKPRILTTPCGRIQRRMFLADVGLGITGLAMGALLAGDGIVRGNEHDPEGVTGLPLTEPKAKKVIWVFLSGGYSQMETFDPKPALTKYADKSYDETEYPNPLKDPNFRKLSRDVVGGDRLHSKIFPLQVGFQKHGESGIEMSDWWPELAKCVDDLCFVRSMYTTDNDHAAEFQIHHGRHKLDPPQPAIGSWINYGLGTLNENLPAFVFLGNIKDPRIRQNFDADYLGPQYSGVELALDGNEPLPFGKRGAGVLAEEQRGEFEFIRKMNQLSSVEYPEDDQLRARIKAYELAYRMQMSVPDVLNMSEETQETQALYGIDNETTAIYGRRLLAARRLAEKGVRYTLCYLSDYGEWDSHTELKTNHTRSCQRVDKPISGLIKDLKRRGMWDDTVVVFCTEFGRTPGVEVRDAYKVYTGRDHHPHSFTIWLAGAGIKQGYVHGKTDELGFHVVENPHYVTDLHATLLKLMGLDARKLNIPGRKRLDIDYGVPIDDILA